MRTPSQEFGKLTIPALSPSAQTATYHANDMSEGIQSGEICMYVCEKCSDYSHEKSSKTFSTVRGTIE